MNTIIPSFAPTWLARTVLEDTVGLDTVEQFLRSIPQDIHGGIILTNETTGQEYRGADRYMPTIVYLASIWTIKNHSFTLSGLKTGASMTTVIDTNLLLTVKQGQLFTHALQVGEEIYKSECTERLLRGDCEEQNPSDL
jgi:hypothetical protein